MCFIKTWSFIYKSRQKQKHKKKTRSKEKVVNELPLDLEFCFIEHIKTCIKIIQVKFLSEIHKLNNMHAWYNKCIVELNKMQNRT